MTDDTKPSDASPALPTCGRLLLVSGEGLLSTYDLADRELVIGRADECDVRLDHPALSRRHAAIRGGPPVAVVDLGSTNGTQIAGAVRRGGAAVELAIGESFQIGPFSFLIVARGTRHDRALSGRDLLRVIDPTPSGVPAVIADVAATRANVLILGETGVGKEVLAETVHVLSGRPGPFTRINCAALSESLIESELFGYERGAFTGATASKCGLLEGAEGGTVFLDEVGELPLTLQAKLLRAVERREVLRVGAIQPRRIDVRFVAATNRELAVEVDAGRFRRDLFFRLEEVTLVIPPLRERRGLVAPLALQFLGEVDERGRKHLDAGALAALEAHAWAGNVRELRSVIARAALLARGSVIDARHLGLGRNAPSIPKVDEPEPAPAATAPASSQDERGRILAALDACAGNQTRAARMLGIGRSTLLKRLGAYQIARPRVRDDSR